MKTPNGIILGHADHGLGPKHLEFIDTLLEGWDGNFKMLHVDMPEECSDLLSALYGPEAGDEPVTEDEVLYKKRNGRPGPSRLVNRPPRPCRKMVIIAGPTGKMVDEVWIPGEPLIYTAYGSPTVAPREWWDAGMNPLEAIVAATFWSKHALSVEA